MKLAYQDLQEAAGLVVNGYNADIDQTREDVWSAGGTYAFPAAAAATTIESSSSSDAAAGTGARTVYVDGLLAGYVPGSETATLNGTNAVTLTNQYLRINKLYVLTVGSGGKSAGTISVKQSSTVIGSIETGLGESRTAVYTTPAGVTGWVVSLAASIGLTTAASTANVILHIAPAASLVWQEKTQLMLNASATSSIQRKFVVPFDVPPKSDIRISAATGQDNTDVGAQFELLFK